MARVSSATATSSGVHSSIRFRPVRAASRTASPEPRSRSVAVARTPIESRVTMPRLVDSWTRRWLSRTTGAQTADTSR